jgi:ubiquinone/menaquinone biosynthesis C-methylase UbiE
MKPKKPAESARLHIHLALLRNSIIILTSCLALAQPPTDAQLNQLYSQMDDALGLHPGAMVADIGTGFAVDRALRIAEKFAPGGKIVCGDVKQSVLTKIRDKADAKHVTNLETVLGEDDDPMLPAGTFDAILVSNTYHEFTQPSAMLNSIRQALKPDGTLVVVENCSIAHRTESRAEQTKLHDIAPDILERELSADGFVVKERIDPILIESPDRFRYLVRAEKSK